MVVHTSAQPLFSSIVDIWLRNIVALASTASRIRPVVVKEGMLKSINAMYNKDVASLQSHGKKTHRRSKVMKRTCRINDKMRIRFLVLLCSSACETIWEAIIIGHNEGGK